MYWELHKILRSDSFMQVKIGNALPVRIPAACNIGRSGFVIYLNIVSFVPQQCHYIAENGKIFEHEFLKAAVVAAERNHAFYSVIVVYFSYLRAFSYRIVFADACEQFV